MGFLRGDIIQDFAKRRIQEARVIEIRNERLRRIRDTRRQIEALTFPDIFNKLEKIKETLKRLVLTDHDMEILLKKNKFYKSVIRKKIKVLQRNRVSLTSDHKKVQNSYASICMKIKKFDREFANSQNNKLRPQAKIPSNTSALANLIPFNNLPTELTENIISYLTIYDNFKLLSLNSLDYKLMKNLILTHKYLYFNHHFIILKNLPENTNDTKQKIPLTMGMMIESGNHMFKKYGKAWPNDAFNRQLLIHTGALKPVENDALYPPRRSCLIM